MTGLASQLTRRPDTPCTPTLEHPRPVRTASPAVPAARQRWSPLDGTAEARATWSGFSGQGEDRGPHARRGDRVARRRRGLPWRSEEHTSELQSRLHLVCRLLLEKKKQKSNKNINSTNIT